MNKLISAIAAAFFSFILWIIYQANTGNQNLLFKMVGNIPFGDKLGHLVLFGALTLIVVVASQFKYFSLSGYNYYYGAVAVTLFVIIEELSQAFIPSRTFDLCDLLADMLGIVLAIKLYQLH
ncbi:Conserved hypothetical protein [Shewanella piezotolerans WP3]|uniref:VanZ-like domain-containing protein n=1 Tax=Shewanella piezotolerans (strain WP3 / JCM 13877) TaxID=225849 RepID=B8CPW9_SHEPW|nr:VanZ family protein [Shewanella piezotolerans]ACJ29832.1 Conserved hypothetical protein [Shewanella piezotolerans WP3]